MYVCVLKSDFFNGLNIMLEEVVQHVSSATIFHMILKSLHITVIINFFLFVYLQPVQVEAEWIVAPRRLKENVDYTTYESIAKVSSE